LPAPLPEDDDRERECAQEIAELIGKSPQATAVLLTRNRAGPAYKFAGKWRMRPSRWRQWRQEQEDATLAKGEETPATRKTKSAQHILRQQRRTRSGVSDAPLTAAPAIAAADGTQSQK